MQPTVPMEQLHLRFILHSRQRSTALKNGLHGRLAVIIGCLPSRPATLYRHARCGRIDTRPPHAPRCLAVACFFGVVLGHFFGGTYSSINISSTCTHND
jgi:hypothetical protein